MGWDLTLRDPVSGNSLHTEAPHCMHGGNYVQGGTTEMWMHITYNYGKNYRRPEVLGDGCIGQFHGMTGLDSIPILETAVAGLGDNVSSDYWEPTDGNAKRALLSLLALAKMRPDGVWDVD